MVNSFHGKTPSKDKRGPQGVPLSDRFAEDYAFFNLYVTLPTLKKQVTKKDHGHEGS